MAIQTKFHGILDIQADQTWHFPKGIPGFENEKQFTLLPIEGNVIFQVLQSTSSPDVALIVSNPFNLVNDYSLDIDESTIDLLSIEKEIDVLVLGVITLKKPFEMSTINLQAPIIMHVSNKKAKQMILNDSNWSLRHPIGQPIPKGAN